MTKATEASGKSEFPRNLNLKFGNLNLKWYVNLGFRENWYKSYSRPVIFCGGIDVEIV